MNIDNIQPTSLENLPIEIFLKVFASLSLKEIVTAFSDLNSYINSIIRCAKDGNHAVTYNDTKAVELLHSFPTQICRLIITLSPNVDLMSLKNLRSLTIKYGTIAQLNKIIPQHFPVLEILHIQGVYEVPLNDRATTISNLFQMILSNGFRRLRICTAAGIGSLDSNQVWTGSPCLRFLLLDGQTPLIYGLILSVCPNLRLAKSFSEAQIDRPIGKFIRCSRRSLTEILRIKEWESENKFILEYCSIFDMEEPTQSLNSRATNQHVYNREQCVIRGRIFPEKDPYCFASFLIEIRVPSVYPFKVPEVIILDPIYHPNVRKDGSHCYCHRCGYWSSIAEPWKASTYLSEVINAVINTIDNPHFKHPQNEECANEYQNDYNRFYEKALQYTFAYGRPRY